MSKAHFRSRSYVIRVLANALHRGRLAIFLGSGVSRELVNKGSARIGLPKWQELIRRLYASQRKRVPSGSNYPQQVEDFRNWFIEGGRTLNEFHGLVQQVLYDGVSLDFSIIRKNATLAGIGALVAHSQRGRASEVFTLNFDDVVERYLRYYGIVAKPVTKERFWSESADVLIHHPHGFLPSPGSPFGARSSFLVFDEKSYLTQHPDGRWDQRMEVAMQASTCLLIGLGRDDIHLKSLVERSSRKHAFSSAKDGYWGIVLRARPTRAEVLDWRQYHVHVQSVSNYQTDLPAFLFDICQVAADLP